MTDDAFDGLTDSEASLAAERDEAVRQRNRLFAAIKKHHAQKADDRCWLDDAELYAAAGLPPADVTIESPSAMLKNCERFIELRMCGKSDSWKSYREIELELILLNEAIDQQPQEVKDDITDYCAANRERR